MNLTEEIKRYVRGKKIVNVRLRRQYDQEYNDWIYDPILTLNSGADIQFIAQESSLTNYGVLPIVRPPSAQPNDAVIVNQDALTGMQAYFAESCQQAIHAQRQGDHGVQEDIDHYTDWLHALAAIQDNPNRITPEVADAIRVVIDHRSYAIDRVLDAKLLLDNMLKGAAQ